jgi:hypothetical protein
VATRGVTRAYTADEVDFIVVYLVPENLWYVIPISLAALRNRMYLSPNRPLHSENEKYREAWCQMACPRDESAPTRLLLKRQPDYPFDECKLCNLKCPLKEIRIPLTRDRRGRWRKSPCLSAAEKESVQASGQRFRSSSVP